MAYLEDLGCLGTTLVELLGGEVDFEVMDGFEVILVDEFTLVLVNVKGLGGGGGGGALREPIDSNRSFPVISTPKIFLAAFETLRHMLDFRSSMSCLKPACEYELHILPNTEVSAAKDHGKTYIKVRLLFVSQILRNHQLFRNRNT